MDKYNIKSAYRGNLSHNLSREATSQTLLMADGQSNAVATFYDKSLAKKVCDLLNETSRSQGKWPK